MDDLLLGYLLSALEPDEMARVEGLLASDPLAQTRLVVLRRLLDPLGDDGEALAPPAELAQRTLSRLAELPPPELPRAPRPTNRYTSGHPSHWRRADVLIAATLMLCVFGVGIPWVYIGRIGNEGIATNVKVQCQDNLRQFHGALKMYSDRNGGKYPTLKWPRHTAGMIGPILCSAGAPVKPTMIHCPAVQAPPPDLKPMHEVLAMDKGSYEGYLKSLDNSYAYSLGFDDGKGGTRWDFEPKNKAGDLTPIMADCPPSDLRSSDNSPSHGGSGQYVLHLGGNVDFKTTRILGNAKDDIYLNHSYKVGKGVDASDCALGNGLALP